MITDMISLKRWTTVWAVLFAMLASFVHADALAKVDEYKPWEKETLTLAESLPVQDGGRVKPFSSYASFTMLRLHGARSMKIEVNGKNVTIKPVAWMMDALFRPHLAVQLPTFRLDNSEVLDLIGVKVKGKRDRYSYDEIKDGRDRLFELEAQYSKIKKEHRQLVEEQTIAFADNIRSFEQLLSYFAFARAGVVMPGRQDAQGNAERTSVSMIMQTAPTIRAIITESQQKKQPIPAHVAGMLQQILDFSNYAVSGLLVVPSSNHEEANWRPAGALIMGVMNGESKTPEADIAEIQRMENVVHVSTEDQVAFREQFSKWKQGVVEAAKTRGETRSVSAETWYNRKDLFLYALVWFLLGSVLVIPLWLIESETARRWLGWGVWACVLAGLGYCVTAIAMRVWIMERPPVGNLYDTIIFIAATTVFFVLLIELMTRRRFALAIAPILGAFFVLLSRLFEVGDAKDHMDPLIAVLRSNYWLTIHVITITVGYASGLLSAAVSMVYTIGRGFHLIARSERRTLTRIAYGCVCLTLLFSLVGTVLGGVWANDSWGRFWGWDPKENGALMIVLWSLAILHARLGGYLKEWGLHIASVFGAILVTFSWWHVNFLGVGLHNYGFTSGKGAILFAYAFIGLIAIMGGVFAAMDRFKSREHKVKDEEEKKEEMLY